MSADDDADCPHVWRLETVIADARGARLVHRCTRCDGLSYEGSQAGD